MSLKIKPLNLAESIYIDTLKVIMLAQVTLGHAIALSLPKYADLELMTFSGLFYALIRSLTGFGREAAFQFIFLSGFLAASGLLNYERKFELGSVIFKRLKRLYPVIFLALLVTLIFDFFGAYLWHLPVYDSNSFNYVVREHWRLNFLLLNFLSLQPTFSLTFGSNGPLWTLGYLVQFFVVVAVLRSISGQSFLRLSGLIIFVSIVDFLIFGWEPSLVFLVWFFGMFVRTNNKLIIPGSINSWVLILLTLIVISIARISAPWISVLLTPLIGFLIISLTTRFPVDAAVKINNFIKPISKLSFGIYAIHMPILFFCFGMLQFFFKVNKLNGVEVIIFLVSSLVISVLVAFSIEKILSKIEGV